MTIGRGGGTECTVLKSMGAFLFAKRCSNKHISSEIMKVPFL